MSGFRVIGTRQNRSLILTLDRLVDSRVWVATPMILPTHRGRNDAVAALNANQAYRGTVRPIGGWTLFDEPRRKAYELSLAVDRKRDVMPALEAHPVYPALSFLTLSDLDRVAELLGLILDPCFYVNANRPSRSRLDRFFGLDAETVRKASRVKSVTTSATMSISAQRLARCRVALDASRASPLCDLRKPGAWLSRYVVQNHGPGAAMGAARRLIRYIELNWLEVLFPNVGDGLFVPSHFFNDESVESAYAEHMRRFKASAGAAG
jgi:hypothetical protein